MTPYVVLIVAVALERLAELVVSRRNLAAHPTLPFDPCYGVS